MRGREHVFRTHVYSAQGAGLAGCFACSSFPNSWSFPYPHFKDEGPETQRHGNKLPNVIQLSGRAGVWTPFCQLVQPIQFVLFNQPTSGLGCQGSTGTALENSLGFKEGDFPMSNFGFFFFFNVHNLSRAQLHTSRWERDCPECKTPCLPPLPSSSAQHTLPLESAFITSAWPDVAGQHQELAPPLPGC